MSRQLLRLNWLQFDEAVRWIAGHISKGEVDAVCGAPRGGLPLAVALSHALGVPLIHEPRPGCLWVDDIIDSGATALAVREAVPGIVVAAWVQRGDHGAIAPRTLFDDRWVLFPWEVEQNANQEAKTYALSRQ